MSSGSGRFLRENVFLVAAVSLPLVIVALFLLLSAIPRWTVPAPAYDVLIRTSTYEHTGPGTVSVEFVVQNEQLQVTVREAGPHTSPSRSQLWLVDRQTLNARQIPVKIPQLAPGEKERTLPVEALEGKRVVSEVTSPDGYELQDRTEGGGGLLGELFGMRRYGSSLALVNRGRVIKLSITGSSYYSPTFVGWVIGEGMH
jgi:hypothetical protein